MDYPVLISSLGTGSSALVANQVIDSRYVNPHPPYNGPMMSSTAPGNLETLKEKNLNTKLKMASFKAEFASMKLETISKMGWNGSVMKDVLSQKDSLADR